MGSNVHRRSQKAKHTSTSQKSANTSYITITSENRIEKNEEKGILSGLREKLVPANFTIRHLTENSMCVKGNLSTTKINMILKKLKLITYKKQYLK